MNELLRATLTRNLVALLPQCLRGRTARLLYNAESRGLHGMDLVVNYLGEPDLKFLLNTKEFIGWNIFFTGAYERDTNRLLRQFVKAGDVVVEAGANNGSETVLLGRLVGSTGRVHAFEPVPHVLKRLQINLLLNDLEAVVPTYALALGETEAPVKFHLLPRAAVNQGMSSKSPFAEFTEEISVTQTTLDAWSVRAGIGRLDFLKMDIQGAEIDLIAGARQTLRKFQPILFTEAEATAQADGSHSVRDLWTALVELGYRVFQGTRGRLGLLSDPDELREGNWLAVPAGHPLSATLALSRGDSFQP